MGYAQQRRQTFLPKVNHVAAAKNLVLDKLSRSAKSNADLTRFIEKEDPTVDPGDVIAELLDERQIEYKNGKFQLDAAVIMRRILDKKGRERLYAQKAKG